MCMCLSLCRSDAAVKYLPRSRHTLYDEEGSPAELRARHFSCLANGLTLGIFYFCLSLMFTEGLPFSSAFLYGLWRSGLNLSRMQLNCLLVWEHLTDIYLRVPILSPHRVHWISLCHLAQLYSPWLRRSTRPMQVSCQGPQNHLCWYHHAVIGNLLDEI